VYDREMLCLGGEPLLTFLQNQSSMTDQFANGTCSFVGPTTGNRGATSFPCSELQLNALRLWGCFDAQRSLAAQSLAASEWRNAVLATSPTTFDVRSLLKDPAGDLELGNFKSFGSNFFRYWSKLSPWLEEVESCYNTNAGKTVPCTCTTDAQCATGPGQTCVAGVCQNPDQTVAQCSVIRAEALTVQRCCGDGKRMASEACDDGNTANGDGCSDQCQTENHAACCLASECVDLGSPHPRVRGATASTFAKSCTNNGGYAVVGSCCSEINQCGLEQTGSCRVGNACHDPSTPNQCSHDGGTFSTGHCPPGEDVSAGDLWLPFDELTNGTTPEVLGHRHTLAAANNLVVGGIVGNAFDFRGNSARVDDFNSDYFSGDFSASFWVRSLRGSPTRRFAPPRILLRQVSAPSRAAGGFKLALNWLGGVDFSAPGIGSFSSPAFGLDDGRWHQVVVTVARTGSESVTTGGVIYVDSVAVKRFSTGATSSTNTGLLFVGGGAPSDPRPPGASFTGYMDDVLIQRHALTQAAVVALWKTDQGMK
jgi:cysteine-rich repeat protein